ncbi:MAG: glycoside hydrolase family 26 protein [Gemmatimonadaceae bacterium]
MRRGSRLLLVGAAIAGSAAFVSLLTLAGSVSEGPIGAALDRIGTVIGSMEHGIRGRLAGPGRSGDLLWFAPYRQDIERLKRPGAVLLGAYDSELSGTFEGVVEIERHIQTTFPLVHVYTAWGDKPGQRFPLRLATAIWNLGSVPVITWEPWLTDFESTQHPSLPLRDARERHGLAAVARGDYDFYVDGWAADAARFGKPLFLRFAHEMNDPYRYPWGPQNNTTAEYIAAWRHVVDRFRLAGVRNVIWVWSPHVAYASFETYYPGNEYVDWVSTGALNYGPIAQWSQWWTFAEIFGTKYTPLASFGKPVMIAEFASLEVGGDRATWYRDALTDLPRKHPAVQAVLFFHARVDQTVTQQQVDWSITRAPEIARTIADAIQPWTPARGASRTAPAPDR